MALITIAQWPQSIEAGRLRVLEAALDAGVPFPHGCGSGECGTCKCQLLSGKVTMDNYSPDALSDVERDAGMILACRSRVVSDVSLRWLSTAAPPLPMMKFKARATSAALRMMWWCSHSPARQSFFCVQAWPVREAAVWQVAYAKLFDGQPAR